MEDLTPEDLSRQIERLWDRVSGIHSETPSFDVPPPTGFLVGSEVAWETVAILKRQQREREETWRETLSARDNAMEALRSRLKTIEEEAAILREHVEGESERERALALEASHRIEAARKSVQFAEQRHIEERRVLEETLSAMRDRIASEISRARQAEARHGAREQQNAIDLKELAVLAQRREAEAAAAEKSVRALEASMGEAKNALEKTLAELLLERKERERAEGERGAAVKKVDELRAHVDEMTKVWEEERAQWRELWDRERKAWEDKRHELEEWETKLRAERESWHADLKSKEAEHIALTEDLSTKIRETSENAEKISSMISEFEEGAPDTTLGGAGTVKVIVNAKLRAQRRWRVVYALAAAAAVAFAWDPAVKFSRGINFIGEADSELSMPNPTGVAVDGSRLWISDWSGHIFTVSAEDPRRILSDVFPEPGGSYRPSAIASGGGVVWTLDAAQARIVRHSAAAADRILSMRPSPGPAPTALAYDGETIWSYDAVNRAVTRHGGDDAALNTYSLPDEAVVNAMAWVAGKLWMHDVKGRRILIYSVDRAGLKRETILPDPEGGVIGLSVAGGPSDRKAYILYGASGTHARPALSRYLLRRKIPFARF